MSEGKKGPARLKQLREEALKLVADEKFAAALPVYDELTRLDRSEGEWPRRAADCCWRLGKDPQRLHYTVLAARAYSKSGLLLKAIAMCKVALSIDPHHKESQAELARLHAKKPNMPTPHVPDGALRSVRRPAGGGAQAVRLAQERLEAAARHDPTERSTRLRARMAAAAALRKSRTRRSADATVTRTIEQTVPSSKVHPPVPATGSPAPTAVAPEPSAPGQAAAPHRITDRPAARRANAADSLAPVQAPSKSAAHRPAETSNPDASPLPSLRLPALRSDPGPPLSDLRLSERVPAELRPSLSVDGGIYSLILGASGRELESARLPHLSGAMDVPEPSRFAPLAELDLAEQEPQSPVRVLLSRESGGRRTPERIPLNEWGLDLEPSASFTDSPSTHLPSTDPPPTHLSPPHLPSTDPPPTHLSPPHLPSTDPPPHRLPSTDPPPAPPSAESTFPGALRQAEALLNGGNLADRSEPLQLDLAESPGSRPRFSEFEQLEPNRVEWPETVLERQASDRQFLLQTGLFSQLGSALLESLIEIIAIVELAPHEVLFQEGDTADAMYVIVEGAVAAMTTPQLGGPIQLARLEEGEFFGEIGLLSDQPRQATVSATEPTRLLRFDRSTVGYMIDQDPSFLEVLLTFLKGRLVENLMVSSPLMASLDEPDKHVLVEQFEFLEVERDSLLLDHGQPPIGMYVLLTGRALLSTGLPGKGAVSELVPGDIFGEQALLSGGPSRVRVTTASKCFALCLPSDAFMEMITAHPTIRQYLTSLGQTDGATPGMDLLDHISFF